MKVLICGHVEDERALDLLCGKVATLNDAKGPFGVCFAVGLFCEGNDHLLGRDFPIPLYFMRDEAPSCDLGTNMNCLVGGGCETVGDLRVAYLSRLDDDAEGDLSRLGSMLGAGPSDILLTRAWPRGIHTHVPSSLWPLLRSDVLENAVALQSCGKRASAAAAWRCGARYHFASETGTARPFFRRVPWQNEEAGVTRFVGLGDVGHPTERWLHAVEATPQTPTPTPVEGSTPNPFTATPLQPIVVTAPSEDGPSRKRARGLDVATMAKIEEDEGGKVQTQAFWDLTSRSSKQRESAILTPAAPLGSGEEEKVSDPNRRLPPGAVRECWFCPGSPSFQRHLVVSVGTDALLTLPRGGIDVWHVLAVPIAHVPALAAASDAVQKETRKYRDAMTQAMRANGKCMVLAERAVRLTGPAHAHVSFNGIPVESATRALDAVIAGGRRHGIEFRRLKDDETLTNAVQERQYLYFEVPDPSNPTENPPFRLVHLVTEYTKRAPLLLARHIVCDLLGAPDRAHWKECTLEKDEEASLAKQAREYFAPFDFNN